MHEPSKTLPKLGHSCCALFTNKAFAASDQFVNPSTQPWQALTSTSTNYIQTAKGARRFVGEEVALQTGRKQNWGSKEAFFGKDGGALRWVVKQSNRLCLVVFTLGFTSMLDMYVYIYTYIKATLLEEQMAPKNHLQCWAACRGNGTGSEGTVARSVKALRAGWVCT